MKISIITATLNNEDTIKKTLHSIDNQAFSNTEHLIIDGKSTDRTLEFVENSRTNKKIFSAYDGGIYFALNKGIEKSTGDIIGFLHADDYYSNNSILEKINNIFTSENCDVLYGDLDYISGSGKIVRHWEAGSFDAKKLKKGWMPPHPTFFVRKELYQKFGLFDTNFKIAADYDLMLRFLTKNLRVYYLAETLVKMRTGGESNKNIKNIFHKSTEDLKIIRKNNIGGLSVLFLKNISKLSQFIKK